MTDRDKIDGEEGLPPDVGMSGIDQEFWENWFGSMSLIFLGLACLVAGMYLAGR